VTDTITISGLRVMASVGVLDEERQRIQPLIIDCVLEVDLTAAGASDALNDTINYATVIELAENLALSHHHDLLESLADEIARGSLALDDRIAGIDVAITKVRPPVGQDVHSVGVTRSLRR
jgi:dihydroneopterin aldolase